jgi:hypothetical protein
MKSRARLWQSRIAIVALGILLGLVARFVIGPPAVENDRPAREFKEPLPEHVPIDFPISGISSGGHESLVELSTATNQSGFVEPIDFPTHDATTMLSDASLDFDKSLSSAVFEPHGEKICASGCALSRHPTETLARKEFVRLISEFRKGPLSSDNQALESLLYFGPQTVAFLKAGFHRSSTSAADETAVATPDLPIEFLQRQLRLTHAKISIRVVDTKNKTRTWLEPTLVPLDRRHVFEMKTNELRPLVTSGTVKRVGLNHLWTRL